ncbi:MAG: ATP-binding protein [Saprospiraceae bacterium]|nr:ATP-binding protein [Saprospiraceae bacterium]
MQHKPFTITIVGPESSGKTTLARELATIYGVPWIPEYAREYLYGLGRPYHANDLKRIAEGQLDSISRVLNSLFSIHSLKEVVMPPGPPKGLPASTLKGVKNQSVGFELLSWRLDHSVLTFQREEFGDEPRPLVIVDSGMLSLRMWARIKYGITIPVVENALNEDVTSLYILCRPFVEWEADPLREAPSLLDRVWIYNQYLKELNIIPRT